MNKNLKANLSAIKKLNKEYHDKILDSEKEFWITYTRSKNRDYNFIIKSDANIMYPAYDLDNARKPIKEMMKETKLTKNDTSVVLGLGCGHLVRKILEVKEEKHTVIVIEPCFDLIKNSLSNYDFSKYIEDGSLILVSDLLAVRQAIAVIDSNKVIDRWLLNVEAYTNARVSVYGKFIEEARNAINQVQCGTGTVMAAGKEIALNDIRNIPNCIGFPGVKSLAGKFKNKPAVLVNTGPSLKKNIHIIKKIYEDKTALILAVGQALRVLLSYDIIPDIIATVDYGKVNITHFNGLMECQIPLVALNRTHADLLDKWQGPKFIASTPYHAIYEGTACAILAEKGYLDQGGSVSHFLFGLAKSMGCSPIIFTGLDLALTDNKSHIVNADSQGDIYVDENGIIQWEVKDKRSPELDGKKHQMGIATYVDGYFGDKVLTNIGLKSFITSFENLIVETTTTVIDATQGGARIKGAKQMSLKKAKRLYMKEDLSNCKKEIKKIYEKELKKEKSGLKKKINTALEIIINERDTIKSLAEKCLKGLEWNEKIKKAHKDKKKEVVKKALHENEKYSNEARQIASKNSLITSSIYAENRRISSAEFSTKGVMKYKVTNEDDLKIRLKRNKIILEATLNESKNLLKFYDSTISKLEILKKKKYNAFKVEDREALLDDAESFLEKGNWAIPYLESCRILNDYASNTEEFDKAFEIHKRCVKIRNKSLNESRSLPDETRLIDYNELVYEAILHGKEQKNFEESNKLLDQAIKLFPGKKEALWGKATVLCFFGKYKESLEVYNRLIEKIPDNNRLKFEKALVYLNLDTDVGIKELLKIMEACEEYKYFLKNIARIYSKKNVNNKAIYHYEEYLKLYPYDEEAKEELRNIRKIYQKGV